MTERVQILLIVAAFAALATIVFLYRKHARRIKVNVSTDGFQTDVETHDPAAAATQPRPRGLVSVKDSLQKGKSHEIDISRGDVEIERHRQLGENQRLNVRSTQIVDEERSD